MLSGKTSAVIDQALADQLASNELKTAINTGFNATPAADVADNSPAGAITIALSTSDTYTDSAVNSAVNAALSTVRTDINADRTQINAILAALRAAGLML
jgi:hypothetical protein